MELGAFSISLNVSDLNVSKKFYESIGFKVFAGDLDQNYLIMKNGDSLIGLFQGMFDKNILTFNPGWDQEGNTLKDSPDIREIYIRIKDQNILTEQESLEGDKGPGSFIMIDPDGNPILIDQHN
ncbi:MAG: VOC family protein [Alkalibacterium sp.]|nr:VOC family protein [Alkalibacterium sp.]